MSFEASWAPHNLLNILAEHRTLLRPHSRSHSTELTSIRHALQGLEIGAFEASFRAHAAHLQGTWEGGRWIAIDGKTLRGSFDHLQDRKAARLLSALSTESTLVFGHLLLGGDWVFR